MNDYFSAVQAAFSAGGVIARAQPHFRPRSGQTAMAMAVAETISSGGVLVVEAGTGVGKTYSYLVPALLSGQRVLISTATKALQDQLFARDLPGLAQMLGLPLRMSQLKGRPSYLCQHHLGQARQGRAAPQDPQLLRTLARVEEWARITRTGDLAELSSVGEDSPVWPLVTSTRDNCLGSACPHFVPCHLNVARREALVADVVVVNHHLFFADLEVRESGVAQLLPSVGVVVFDEAHQLNETGIQFAGTLVGTAQLQGYARDFLAQTLEHARGMGDWMQLSADLERTVRDLRLAADRTAVGRTAVGERLRWLGAVPDGLDRQLWSQAFSALGQALHAALVALGGVEEMAAELRQLYARGEALLRRLALFGRTSADDSVRWLDVGSRHLRMIESPLSIARIVRTRLLQEDQAPGESAGAEGTRPGAWIFTSATLGDDADLTWFTEPCGLRDARVLRVDSPFDYAQQAAVYVPREFPAPGTPTHSAEVAALVQRSAEVLGGRTLVLTTTTKALQAIGAALQAQFGLFSDLEVLVQGQAPKQLLLERFRAGQGGGRGCILVASATFWEGVDMPGDALELVVIDKLPFPPPDDPLVEARSQQLEAVGRSAFRDYMLPEAAMALKQGAGRLIRRETDQGVLVIADTRLIAKPYGRRLLAALPPMRRLHTPADYDAALQALALTRTSTTDSSSS